ncbi:hypothetical protein [Nonlabens xiamenensis]|uniref:hypothetical protein n=1 Tax=Nonlabens xiamenensis TaxID=2341043 RepID=UPI000F609614|nr:hypothetical protein [Nonlabens xiamenensis]
MTFFFGSLIMLCLLLSCKKEVEVVTSSTQKVSFADIKLRQPGIELIGKASRQMSEWPEYVDFSTRLENYDHSVAATRELVTAAQKMADTQVDHVDSQPVLSRIKVLQTRLGIYLSYLDYTVKDPEVRAEKFNDIIQALDELKDQINWKVNEYDENRRQLLEDLELDRLADQEAAEGSVDSSAVN